jgi:hypothetical protein
VRDQAAQLQAQRIRDSRGMPEFVFNPQSGEPYLEASSLDPRNKLRGMHIAVLIT